LKFNREDNFWSVPNDVLTLTVWYRTTIVPCSQFEETTDFLV